MADPVVIIPEAELAFILAAPQAKALGFQLISAGSARGALRAPWREDLVGDPDTGVVAGGVVTTLLDHVCGLAIRASRQEGVPVATLDLRIDYMRPAAPRADVIAEAHCYKLTRTIAFVRAHAYDVDAEDPIATAQAAFVLSSPAQPS
jgi:uncharacterized protein (TIGR00369 family)